MSKKLRALPPDVYDALELSALAFRGIGQPDVFEFGSDRTIPNCILGHADFAADIPFGFDYGNPIYNALRAAGIDGLTVSDSAVCAINKRKGMPLESRVTFRQWCRELRVVRGESDA